MAAVLMLVAVPAATAAPATPTSTPSPSAGGKAQPDVSLAVHHDVSPPLREMSSAGASAAQRRIIPLRDTPAIASSGQPDPVRQTSVASLVATVPGVNFPGLGYMDWLDPWVAPPDPNGSVGPTQYVQFVNVSLAVFDKVSGAMAPGFPVPGVWYMFPPCDSSARGSPIVVYDKAAGRWFLSIATMEPPYTECVAVSTTSDATGPYNRYAFAHSDQFIGDYPKVGVWSDAYYVSFNMFRDFGIFAYAYPKVCAYDRDAMLVGAAASQVCFQVPGGSSNFSLLPADLDGATPPSAGAPNYLLALGQGVANTLKLWKFHVDFAAPANSTLSEPIIISVEPFTSACRASCIQQPGPQPGTPYLDSFGDRLMHRLAYRNFGVHESLVANQSVSTGNSVGVRWYELRDPAGTPTVVQQGTYAPDDTYRWMGSIAMDQVGDIVVGYSVSSNSIFPGIRYTGRVPGDPVGTLQAENSVIAGTVSSDSNRWGDYTSMSIDPVDDCTFWYTNEYQKDTSAFAWGTRIASFKFPTCNASVGPAPTLTALSPNQGPTAGGTSVAINGTDFSNVLAVTFGGIPATSFSVGSTTSITAVSPAQTAGIVDMRVSTRGGISAVSAADRFRYIGTPTVTRINPGQGPTAGGTSVTITGTNFNPTTAVNFGALAATSFTVNSSTSITAVSPAQAAGTVDVTVTTTDGTSPAAAADRFTYIAPPSVTGVNPNQGETAGGRLISITGTTFTGATAVNFGSVAATSFTVNSPTSISAVNPAQAAGTVDVTVTTPFGMSAISIADRFTYFNRPVVTGVNPNQGPTTGGTSVTISGSDFAGATNVYFYPGEATSFAINSSTSITAVSPSWPAGTVDVRVSTPGGYSDVSASDRFTFVAVPPTVTGVNPNQGSMVGGTSVTISGTNFKFVTSVKFGTLDAPYTVSSDTSVNAVSPAQSPGIVDVTVTTADGTSAISVADRFTYTSQAPVVSLSPTSLSFGNQDVGTTSAEQVITVQNTGDAPLTVTTIDHVGMYAVGLETCTSGPIAPSGTCAIPVSFSPGVPGQRDGILLINDNASGSPHSAALSGMGIGPAVELSPRSLTFGSQVVGTTSPSQTVTLRNIGNAPLNVVAVRLLNPPPNDFIVTSQTCTFASIAPNDTCTISVSFSPRIAASLNDVVVIDNNAYNSPQYLGLYGTGTPVPAPARQ